MAITTRAGKGSALTHAELDANFETLGLAHGDANADLDVSTLIVSGDIYSGEYELLDTTGYDSLGVKIVSPATKAKWSAVSVIEYGGTYTNELPYGSFHNPTIGGECHGGSEASPAAVPNGKRAIQINGAARWGSGANEVHTIGNIVISTNENQSNTNRGGAITFRVTPNGTDATQDMFRLQGSGSTSMDLSFDPNGYFGNTDWSTASTNGFKVNSAITFNDMVKLEPTPYNDLPTNAGSQDDGKIAYLTFNGAATNNARFKLIYSKGGDWYYVSDDGLVDDGSNGGS